MSYLDVYFARVNHYGKTMPEIDKSMGEHSFERWLKKSPHTVRNLTVERGLSFDGLILEFKDNENKKMMKLQVSNTTQIVVGDILNWRNGNTIEKWLLYNKERTVNGSYQTFYIIQCNYLVKWIDVVGELKSTWVHLVSSMESKVKENFRTWNSVITPQPNKYLEMILPRRDDLNRHTHFIIEDEGWYIVETDFTSVPGVMYVSLTEEKVNRIYDDLKEDVANIDQLAKYEIRTPDAPQIYSVGSIFVPLCSATKNSIEYDTTFKYISSNDNIVKKCDGGLFAVAEGQVEITVILQDKPEIKKVIQIYIESEKQASAYISGSDNIILDREGKYILALNENFNDGEINFSIDNNAYASIIELNSNYCIIKANNDNKLGSFNLIATYKGKEYVKQISVRPLW